MSHQVKQSNVKIIIGFIRVWAITHTVFFFFSVTSPAGLSLVFNYIWGVCVFVHMHVCM